MYAILGFDWTGLLESEEFVVNYDGEDITIKKEKTVKNMPFSSSSNQMYIETNNADEKFVVFMDMLNELVWIYRISILSTELGLASCKMCYNTNVVGHQSGRTIVDLVHYKPIQGSEEQRFILGLYKDTLSTNNVFYQFLSLFKILEYTMSVSERKKWLTELSLGLEESSNSFDMVDFGKIEFHRYIYEKCRCAIAHAKEGVVADSRRFEDIIRIKKAYNTLRTAVEEYMVKDLGIPRFSSPSSYAFNSK